MSNIIIPTSENLDPDKLRQILLDFSSLILNSQVQQREFFNRIQAEINERPTLQQTISALAETPPAIQNPMMYVDIYSCHGIISGLTNKIMTKLDELSQNTTKYEQLVDGLIAKVDIAVKTMYEKCDKTHQIAQKSIIFARRNFLNQNNIKKKSLIFQEMLKNTKNLKTGKNIIKSRIKKIESIMLRNSLDK